MNLLILVLDLIIVSAPFTWLLMLFLGNVGLNVSFWGALPGAVLLVIPWIFIIYLNQTLWAND